MVCDKCKKEIKTPELEDKNFRINSKGWNKVIISETFMLENKEKDIWEFREGKVKGKQLFTFDALMRETKKRNKRVADKDLMYELMKKDDYFKTMPAIGFRNHLNASLNGQGSYGYYWSSSPNGTYAYLLFFDSGSVDPANYNYRANGFSARCLKD